MELFSHTFLAPNLGHTLQISTKICCLLLILAKFTGHGGWKIMDSCLKIMIFSLFSICNWAYKIDTLPTIENEAFIKECVDSHNKFRSQVTPKASNMLRVSWDADLAKVAKEWAQKCKFGHNPDLNKPKKLHPTFSTVGENLWIGSVGSFSENFAIKTWNDKAKDYDFQNKKCTGICGHYTQVVWAESYKIGCAVQYCPQIAQSFIINGVIFVCDYGPAGNYNMQPYTEGEPCSACKEDTCVDQLCTNPKRDGEAASPKPDGDAATHKPGTQETTKGRHKVSLVLILVPIFVILAIILIIVIVIKRYFAR
ncbi:glioma pathogenesis-related protein 1-like [Antechinus flavipes]|uniref:glioma pathogenesis-related protein 1-like n=1 Tax=Antechinus flavipes TaxID=38775 RepID=UPI00223575E1|nr:glioma pathogenesis-related protein 1-like [Antechinus flavipes]